MFIARLFIVIGVLVVLPICNKQKSIQKKITQECLDTLNEIEKRTNRIPANQSNIDQLKEIYNAYSGIDSIRVKVRYLLANNYYYLLHFDTCMILSKKNIDDAALGKHRRLKLLQNLLIGNVYFLHKSYDKANDYYRKTLSEYQPGLISYYQYVLINLHNCYALTCAKDYEKAHLKLIQVLEQIKQNRTDLKAISHVIVYMTILIRKQLYLQQGHYKKLIPIYDAYLHLNQLDSCFNKNYGMYEIASICLIREKQALVQNIAPIRPYNQLFPWLIEIFTLEKRSEELSESLKLYANYLAKNNNYETSYKLLLSAQFKDKAYNRAIELLKINQLDYEEKLSYAKKSEKWFILITVTLSILTIAILLLIQYRFRLNQSKLKIAEFKNNEIRNESNLKILESYLYGKKYESEFIARQLHDDIGGSLSICKLHLSNIVENIEQFSNDNHLLKLKLEELKDQMNDIIGQIRAVSKKNLQESKSISNNDLLRLFKDYGYLKQNDLLQMQLEKLHFDRMYDDFKQNLYFVFQEVLHNADKYGKKGTLQFNLSVNDYEITITSTNETAENALNTENNTGIGLINIQYRINKFEGTCFQSTDNGIYRIEIKIPLKNLYHD